MVGVSGLNHNLEMVLLFISLFQLMKVNNALFLINVELKYKKIINFKH